jgi:hypothetical protein
VTDTDSEIKVFITISHEEIWSLQALMSKSNVWIILICFFDVNGRIAHYKLWSEKIVIFKFWYKGKVVPVL